uniref:LON peptidase N-terminal domain and ring finger 2 n=1 Tax=Chelydra serpentina TaxID=8475 RepID=A0A8C3XVS9_CHESE
RASEAAPPPGPEPAGKEARVAEEAFRGGNFELAAEIYGSQLAELPQPERGLCLRRGDALARAGRMAEALEAYSAGARLARLRPEELRELAESLALRLREKALRLPPWPGGGPEGAGEALGDPACCRPPELLGCPLCRRLLCEPLTLHCGHTRCRRCAEPGDCGRCPRPRRAADGPDPASARVNVVLGNLLEKWLEGESRARRLRAEGDELRDRQELPAALEKYNQALETAPCKCSLIAQRAELWITMKNYQQALHDSDALCQNKPLWPKGHYVKAQALSGLGRTEEALKEFLYCVALNPEWSLMKKEAQKIMCEMFFPAFENVHDSLTAPFSSRTRLKPAFLSSLNTVEDALSQEPDVLRSTNSSLSHTVLDLHFEDNKKSLGTILSSLPGTRLKRKLSSDLKDLQSLDVPNKIPKKDTVLENSTTSALREIPAVLVDASDFECSLCMRLFYEPVTTPCGHTFCLKCLERCLDHNPYCPLCKEKLSEFLASRTYKKTVLTEELIVRYLPEELSERKKVYEEEMKELSNLNEDVPIFVCTMAFPTIPCPLHVFEPRYRLMIRRCMETGTKQFGMCLADELKGFADYGCMLEIRDVKFFPDGRSVVDTVGVRRFKVLNHGQRDGYNTANIEYLEDKKVEGAEYEELVRLHDSVYDQAVAWFTSLKDNMKAQILNHFGSMPGKESEPQSNPCGPAWYWWLLAVLPLENRAQLAILAMTSLKDRLIAIRRVLIFVTRKRPR